jgi:hypothetical protein
MARVKSGTYRARKGIPKDIRDAYHALYGRGWEEIFTAPAGISAQQAKQRRSEWEAEIESRIGALRAKQRGEGHDLTKREADALAGAWYRWFVSRHEEDPREPGYWAQADELLIDEVMFATPSWDCSDPAFAHRDRAMEPEAREAWHAMLTDAAGTAQFLQSKGEALTRQEWTPSLTPCLINIDKPSTYCGAGRGRTIRPMST